MAAPVLAADFRIELSAQSGKPPKVVEAAPSSTQPRSVLMAAADAPVTVRWTLRNLDQATVKDVLVHFFVVKVDKPDQREVPKLDKHVVVESALSMDFRPKDRSEGDLTFTVPQAGCYLIRLELKGAAGKDERQPFAALDLVVR
jgi:hypothetical protein